jgi:hypothetical protein
MTLEDIEASIGNYERMLQRAIKILHGPPFNTCIAEPKFARLHLNILNPDGATTVMVTWPEVSGGYYDSYSIETQYKEIPIEPMTMSEEELAEWQEIERINKIHRDRAEDERRAHNKEMTERAQLDVLLRKYGKGHPHPGVTLGTVK